MKKMFTFLITLSLLASMISVMPVQAAEADNGSTEWAIYKEEDFSTSRWFTPYYKYYGNTNTTYGFAFQGHTGKSTDWANARYSTNFMAMPEPIEGDFIVEFDLFVDDLETDNNGNPLTPQFDSWFRTSVYGGELTIEGDYNKISNRLMFDNVLWWDGKLKDDNDTEYPYKTALASSKYVTVPESGTPSWIDMKMSVIGNTFTAYAKWNTASEWKVLKTYSITEYDGARGICLHGGANVGFDNLVIYKNCTIDELKWAETENQSFYKSAWFAPYYKYYANTNKTYGFVFQGHTSDWANARYSNNFMAMPKGINGDFIVDFDLFVDDVEKNNSGTSLTPQFDSYFRTSVYGGELTAEGDYKRITTKLMNNEPVIWWDGKLKDDNDTEYPYKAALASSKYVTAPESGTPSWIDMKIFVVENTLTVYAKWNTASNWRFLKTYPLTEYDGARGLCLHGGANVGIDNFKVYQRCAPVVDETFESGTADWKDILSVKKTEYVEVTSNSYLSLGYAYNTISTIDSYSDYIVQFDYRPNYYNIATYAYPSMSFVVGGYSFVMKYMASEVGAPQAVTSGATITKENGFKFEDKEWSTIKVKKIDKEFWFYAKGANDDEFTLIYKGTFAENKTAPFQFNTTDTSDVQSGHVYDYQACMDNLKIWDLSSDYVISKPVYDKEVVVNDETVTVSASIMQNKETAEYSAAALVTALYKADGEQWIFETVEIDDKALSFGEKVPFENVIDIPSEGTYKLKSFIWNLDNLYPYCDLEELLMD